MIPAVTIFGLETLEWLGIAASCAAAALALLLPDPRRRAPAMVAALLIAPAVIAGQVWNQAQFTEVRTDPAFVALALGAGILVVAAVAFAFTRRPMLVPLALVAALPFRVPIEAGGATVNILLPLYLAIAGAVAAFAWEALRSSPKAKPAPGSDPAPLPGTPGFDAERAAGRRGPRFALRVALAVFLLIYAVCAAWSIDLDNAAKQAAFFFVPFAVMFRLLLDVRWDRRLVRWAFGILVAEAVVFACVGFWEYQARELLWNPKVVNSNQFESFFRVNSVFWDPNIYGRFLAIVMIGLAGAMLWARSNARALQSAAILAVLWGGLLLTFSQSSFAALLAGLAILAALRWNARWTAIAAITAAVGAVVFVAGFGDTVRLNLGSTKSLDRATSGRVELIRGGLALAKGRPVGGHGSGSFARAYLRERRGGQREAVSASHTEPVTVAAEQGVLGLGAYLAVIATALAALLSGFRSVMPGLRHGWSASGPRGASAGPGRAEASVLPRAVLAAAFGALLFHTLAYAAFLTDPMTWAILAAGSALAAPEN